MLSRWPVSRVRAVLQRSIEPRFDRPEKIRVDSTGKVAKKYGNRVVRSERIAHSR
jgi:hypothetical protein